MPSADSSRMKRIDEPERIEKVPEAVARRILRTIVDGGLVSGARLAPEAEMLVQYGVGRASLREALRILETHGLIRVKPGQRGGPIVTDPSAGDYAQTTTAHLHRLGATLHELVEARLAVEPVMARLAAERLTAASAERIRAARVWGWEAIDGPGEEWHNASQEFHEAVNGGSANHVLDLFASALVGIAREHISALYSAPQDRERTCRIHDRIADAILSGDGDSAQERTRRHIEALAHEWREVFARRMDGIIEWR